MDCCKAFAIIVIVFVVYELYRHMYPTIGVRKWWDGVRKSVKMHKERNAKHKVKNTLKVSAGFVRESLTALFAIFVALWILGYVFDVWNLQEITKDSIIDKIHNNLVVRYPLITTIIGAFIALLCDYFIIHPKLYVSPNAFYVKDKCKNENGEVEEKEVLKWYIENRSLFDCIDIHIDAYECACNNKEGDLTMKKIKLRVNDISTMAGRWASNNDRAILVTAKDKSKEELLKDDFDYIEVVVKVTHALSRVTKVITQQYCRADIYNGVMENDKLYSAPNPKARAEILTLKAGVQKRFMYARKFASYSMVAIIAMMIIKMAFITDEMLTGTLIFNVVIISSCVLLILFSLLRVIYKVPVYTNEENENYMYRIGYKDKGDETDAWSPSDEELLKQLYDEKQCSIEMLTLIFKKSKDVITDKINSLDKK